MILFYLGKVFIKWIVCIWSFCTITKWLKLIHQNTSIYYSCSEIKQLGAVQKQTSSSTASIAFMEIWKLSSELWMLLTAHQLNGIITAFLSRKSSVSASNKPTTNGGPLLRPFHAEFIINSDMFRTNQHDLSDLAAVSSQLMHALAGHKPRLSWQDWCSNAGRCHDVFRVVHAVLTSVT